MKRKAKSLRVEGRGFFYLTLALLGSLFLAVPYGHARERVLLFGDSSRDTPFAEALEETLRNSFPGLSVGELRDFSKGLPLESLQSFCASEELFIGIPSLRELALLLPEALTLGTPFLFYSSGAVELFFEQSRYWELLRERFQELTSHVLTGPAEGGGFFVILHRWEDQGSLLPFQGSPCAASWEAEAAVLYGFGAEPVLLSPEGSLDAFLQKRVAGYMLPLESIDFPSSEDSGFSLVLSSGLYDLRFLVLSRTLKERLGEEGLQLLEEALERANRKVREDREPKMSRMLERFQEQGLHVRELSLKEQAPFAMAARRVYGQWLETKISRSWIDLPLQEAQDANSMAGGQ